MSLMKIGIRTWNWIKKDCRDFLDWIKAHPFKACGFTSLFSQLATFFGCNSHLLVPYGIGIIGALLVPYALVIYRDNKVLRTATLLALALLLVVPSAPAAPAAPGAPAELEPAGGGVAIGVGVLIIGGVAIYYFWDYCARRFGAPPEPPPPEEEEEGFAPTPPAAAVTFSASVSCPDPELIAASSAGAFSGPPGAVVALDGLLVESPSGVEFKIAAVNRVAPSNTVDYAQFAATWAAYGVALDTGWTGVLQTSPGEHPFAVDWESQTLTVDLGTGTHKVTLERSEDLKVWEQYASLRMPIGQPVRLVDTAATEHIFYRVKEAP